MAPLCRGFGISHGRGDRIHDRDHDFGLPSAIRTDNGAPSASPDALFGLSKLSTGRLRLGITIPPIRPGNPQQNGRLERIHLTLEKQATKPASCDCLQWPERFDEWMTVDDTGRPNQPPWARPFPSTVASPDRQGPRRETGSEERAIDQEPRRQALDRDVRGRLDRVRGCHGGAGCSNDPLIVTRTYRATDYCGNTTDVTQTIWVIDVTPPTILHKPDDVVGQCDVVITPPDPNAIDAVDNCGGDVEIIWICDESNDGSGCPDDPLITTRTYHTIDLCGTGGDGKDTFNVSTLASFPPRASLIPVR